MPPPLLTISLSPLRTDHYAGSPLNIICNAELIPEIDVPMLITPTWFKNDSLLLFNTSRISYSQNGSIIMFASLSKAIDVGEYECLILINALRNSQYVTPSLPVEISTTVNISGKNGTILTVEHHNLNLDSQWCYTANLMHSFIIHFTFCFFYFRATIKCHSFTFNYGSIGR